MKEALDLSFDRLLMMMMMMMCIYNIKSNLNRKMRMRKENQSSKQSILEQSRVREIVCNRPFSEVFRFVILHCRMRA